MISAFRPSFSKNTGKKGWSHGTFRFCSKISLNAFFTTLFALPAKIFLTRILDSLTCTSRELFWFRLETCKSAMPAARRMRLALLLFWMKEGNCSKYILALDLSHPTTPEVAPPNGTPVKKSHRTIAGSHPKQVGPPWYTSFVYPWNRVSWTREIWVYLWEVWWIVAKMECTFYVNPNGTLANRYLWFVPALDTSKFLFL